MTNETVALNAALTAAGYTMIRFVVRERYARNGNAHNASKEWCYVLSHNGKVVGSGHTKKAALSLIDA